MNNYIETSIPGFSIRRANREDVPLIMKFIKALAEYEKLTHEVVATEELLKNNLFGPDAVAEVIIGEQDETPVGFALFFHNFSTFLGRPGIYLEDLFVYPEYRGNGYGTALLSYLGKLAVDRGCGRLEWSVLDWNEPAIKFYKSLNAEPMDEWTVYRVTGEALKALKDKFGNG